MGTVVLVDEELIPASPETVFELFGAEDGGGWFFGALLLFGLANEGGPAGPLTFRLGEHSEEQIAT